MRSKRAPYLALDHDLAAEQPQPQAQLVLMIVGPLDHLGFHVERQFDPLIH
jgi:hypothetical protein